MEKVILSPKSFLSVSHTHFAVGFKGGCKKFVVSSQQLWLAWVQTVTIGSYGGKSNKKINGNLSNHSCVSSHHMSYQQNDHLIIILKLESSFEVVYMRKVWVSVTYWALA